MQASERFLLTIKEAADYFNIGEKKLYHLTKEDLETNQNFAVQNGVKLMIKRKRFEEILNNTTSI